METLKKILSFDIFPITCWIISASLFFLAIYGIGFPPVKEIGSTSVTLLILALFFFLLPSSKKISLGKLIAFEKQIEQVKEDVSEFKTETREVLDVYSSMITAISNTVNQTVNVNLPGKQEVQDAKDELNLTLKEAIEPETVENELEAYLRQSGNDLNFALAKMRMEIERSLREILGKRVVTSDPTAMRSGYLSARQLFKEFTSRYPDYQGMHSSFDYILKICNAAIHGQNISDGYGHEALYMGIKMLKEFSNVAK